MSKCYVRFGNIPADGISKAHRGDAVIREEKGISVWDCVFANDVPFPLLPQNASEAAVADYFHFLFSDRPVYLVTGTELDERGSANEPLLKNNITIIREYTEDYKYLKGIFNKSSSDITATTIVEADRSDG